MWTSALRLQDQWHPPHQRRRLGKLQPPIYGSGSLLQYNSGGTYGRGAEWGLISGPSHPYNVQISSNTTLDLGANGGTAIARQIYRNLTIDAGSTLTMMARTI